MSESKEKKQASQAWGISVKKCVVCGKTFVPAPEHIFRRRYKFMCSYSCYREVKRNGKNI